MTCIDIAFATILARVGGTFDIAYTCRIVVFYTSITVSCWVEIRIADTFVIRQVVEGIGYSVIVARGFVNIL